MKKAFLAAGMVLTSVSILSADNPSPKPSAALPETSASLKKVSQESLSVRQLRGYGKIAGEYATYENTDGKCSYLLVQCQDVEKAKVLHAKFHSDLRLMGQVSETKVTAAGSQIPAVEAKGQGLIVAGRIGHEVHIVMGTQENSIKELLVASGLAANKNVEFTPSAAVPMYLDSWDQYAFRFYYRPWESPSATGWGSGKAFPDTKWNDYDVLKEFDYAKEHGDLGFIFWASRSDGGDGLRYDNFWNWAARAARRRKLPTVINAMQNETALILNRYRDQTMMKMPQFCGGSQWVANQIVGGEGRLSWCATTGEAADLAEVQKIVKEYAAQENVIEYMEPRCEPHHGDFDVFLEYGPVADKSYRQYLQQKYKTLDVVSRRWFGEAGRIASWEDVRVPEIASFLGWGPDAVDLTGPWRVGFVLSQDPKRHSPADRKALADKEAVIHPAPTEWYQVAFDDSHWPTIVAPGTDRPMILPRRAAVYRQVVQVDKDWRSKHSQVWLYVWDLNNGFNQWVDAWVNGQKVGHDMITHPNSHWAAFDVSKAMKDGQNLFALYLPNGYLAYRVYLSPHPPAIYPRMSEGDNARWVDFIDWRSWTRVETIRKGMEMIRRADPDRSIICAAPDWFFGGIKQLCQEYGGRFHNTGYMGVFFAEYLPMLMRSADLPFSLEPDSPAPDLANFKNKMGMYLIEGVNAIHYYIHVGSILWKDDIRQEFEKDLPILKALGKTHVPKAQTAIMLSDRVNNLTFFPWGNKDFNTNLSTGYFYWKLSDYVGDEFPMDAVTDLDFGSSIVDDYRVIVDHNTAIMDQSLVDQIEAWVRKGGIFVTFVQTGRHLPEKADAWPISKLTGYRVTGMDPYEPNGLVKHWRKLKFAPGQDVFVENQWDANALSANGLNLQKQDDQCRDLMLWEDGSVAVGMRPLGKGCVFHVGAKFANNKTWWGNPVATKKFFSQLLGWTKVARFPAKAEFVLLTPVSSTSNDALAHHGVGDGVMLRHRISNNGLYDVWAIWNRDAKNSLAPDIVFTEGLNPAWCVDVRTGQAIPVTKDGLVSRIVSLKLEPQEIRMLLTPRNTVASALDWLKLQRNWWQGTTPPRSVPEEVKPWPYYLDLTDDWACLPLKEDNTEDQTPLAAPDHDDSLWKRMPLQAWVVGEELPTSHAIFRKRFSVPPTWSDGQIYLWIHSWTTNSGVHGRMRVWLDGKEITSKPPKPNRGLAELELTDTCPPGTDHYLAVEVIGEGRIPGVYGETWLTYMPNPKKVQDLAGEWTPSPDALHFGLPVTFPGAVEAQTVRRKIHVDAAHAGQAVFLHVISKPGWTGVLVNGHYVRRSRHAVGDVLHLNITPWIRFGEVNEIELAQPAGAYKRQVRKVGLWFYDTKEYP